MKTLILSAAIILFPQVSHAAVNVPDPDVISSAVDQRCRTNLCEQAVNEIMAGKMGRQVAVPGGDIQKCVVANQTFGEIISNTSRKLSEGRSFDDATEIRSLIYTETYFVRATLRDIIAIGDGRQCDKLLRVGNYIITKVSEKYTNN